MNQTELVELLTQSFGDLQLDSMEKQQLRSLLLELSPDLRRFLRNRAFEMVRDAVQGGHAAAPAALRWLEQVSRTLDMPTADSAAPAAAHFSPGSDCRNAVIDLLHRARQQVDICVFTLSDDRIAAAVLASHQRGVTVRLITDNDKALDDGSDVNSLREQGVQVRLDRSEAHMHHKFALFDQRILLNGSFNWTRSASDHNQENLLVTPDPVLVRAYHSCFEQLWERFA